MKRHVTMFAIAIFALTACVVFSACDRTTKNPEKIIIAYATLPETALAQIAQLQGYYRDEGLEATAHLHPYGKRALEELLAGNADFATVAETPVMFAVMKGQKIFVLATIQTSGLGHAILARRDRKIRTIRDLKGKTIAATLGTTSHFYLDTTLVAHGISRNEVKVVDLKAEKIPDALARGEIDAVSAFTPYTAFTQKKLGDAVIAFHDKNLYTYNFNVVATQEFVRKNPEAVKKMLRALVRAEAFARDNPDAAQRITADYSGLDISIVRDIWSSANFNVTLDQPLILALEDESQWAIKNRLTTAIVAPNYLDYIYFDGLRSIKPDAVRILR